eukprot:2689299-Prymnesium_polylepis.2
MTPEQVDRGMLVAAFDGFKTETTTRKDTPTADMIAVDDFWRDEIFVKLREVGCPGSILWDILRPTLTAEVKKIKTLSIMWYWLEQVARRHTAPDPEGVAFMHAE